MSHHSPPHPLRRGPSPSDAQAKAHENAFLTFYTLGSHIPTVPLITSLHASFARLLLAISLHPLHPLSRASAHLHTPADLGIPAVEAVADVIDKVREMVPEVAMRLGVEEARGGGGGGTAMLSGIWSRAEMARWEREECEARTAVLENATRMLKALRTRKEWVEMREVMERRAVEIEAGEGEGEGEARGRQRER